MKGILVELLLLPHKYHHLPTLKLLIYPHSNFSFPNVSGEDMHQYVEPLQPNVPKKNIDYNDRINQWDIDDDLDFEWI